MCNIRLNFNSYFLVMCCIISFLVMSAILVSKKWSDLLKDGAVGHGIKVEMTDDTLCI